MLNGRYNLELWDCFFIKTYRVVVVVLFANASLLSCPIVL